MEIVAVKHNGNNKIYYFWTDISDLKEGDTVVVSTQYGNQLGTIVSTDSDLTYDATEVVLAKVDMPCVSSIKLKLANKKLAEKSRELEGFQDAMVKAAKALDFGPYTTAGERKLW